MKMKFTKILALTLSLLMLITSFAACGEKVAEQPEIAIVDAFDNSIKLAEKAEAPALEELSALLEGNYAAEVTLSLTDLIGSVVSAFSGGIGISFASDVDLHSKSMVNTKEGSSYSKLALVVNGTDFAGIDTYVTSEAFVITSDLLLDGTALGIKLEELAELLSTAMGDVEMPDLEETADIGYTQMLAVSEKLKANAEKLKKAFRDYRDAALEELFAEGKAERTEGQVTVGKETADAVIFTADITQKSFKSSLNKVYEAYKNDTEIRSLIEELAAELYGCTAEDINAIYTELEAMLAEEPDQDIQPLVLSFAIHKKQGNILTLSFTREDESFTFYFPVNPAKPVYMAMGNEEILLSYTAEELEEGMLYTISVTSEGKEMGALTLSTEKESGAYELKLRFVTDPDTSSVASVLLKGTGKLEKNAYTFTLDSINANGIRFEIGLSVKLTKNKEAIPTLPEYQNIADMTGEDAAALLETVQGNLAELVSALPSDIKQIIGGIMGDLAG